MCSAIYKLRICDGSLGRNPASKLSGEHKINPELLWGRREGQMSRRSCQNGTAAYVYVDLLLFFKTKIIT